MTNRPVPVAPPATIGFLGGGALTCHGVIAARTMGYRVVVLDPDPSDPAGHCADIHLVAPFDDTSALDELARTCAVVTPGSDVVPLAALTSVAGLTTVRPSPAVIGRCADGGGAVLREIGAPVADDDLDPATVDRHLSLTLARTADGRTACYPVSDDHLVEDRLDVSVVPASLGKAGHDGAARLCIAIADRLDIVGVLTVEMVVVGVKVLVRRITPAPTAHAVWTFDACQTGVATQLVRAVCGLGLGDPHLVVPAVAAAHFDRRPEQGPPANWAKALHHDTAHLHLYDRDGSGPGHLTVTSGTAPVAANLARRLRSLATSG